MTKVLRYLALALLATGCALLPMQAKAAFPDKPITIVNPFGAGTASDQYLRIFQPFIDKALKQSTVIEYKTGAAGVVGANYYMTVRPDGYTVLDYSLPHILLHEKFMKTSYKLSDLVPVLGFMYSEDLVLVTKDSPFNTFKELVDYIKENPGKVTLGIPGFYTPRHLNYVLFANMLKEMGTHVTLVPFENGGKQMSALLGGQVDVVMNVPGMLAQYEGQLKVLGSLTEERKLPDVPTLKEQGYDGLYGVGGSHFIFINKKAPKEIIEYYQTHLAALANDKELEEAMIKAGQGTDFVVFDYKECEALIKRFDDLITRFEPLMREGEAKK